MSVVKSMVSTDQLGLGGKVSKPFRYRWNREEGVCVIFGLVPLPEVVFLDASQTPHGCSKAILS
jgi:hypothetical protein